MPDVTGDGRSKKSNQPDRDTKELLAMGESMYDLVHSRGWGYARAMLMQKLEVVNSMNQVDGIETRSYEELGREMKERVAVFNIFKEWLQEVEGESEKYESNKALGEKRQESIVQHFD
jgi:hypothetical protein